MKDLLKKELVDLTAELVRFQSMHTLPEEINRCACYIEEYLDQYQIPYQRMDCEGIPSILAMPACGSAPVLLMSHIDVVAADAALFEPIEKDGRLFGRGTLDDKYAVALSLVLLKELTLRFRENKRDEAELPLGVLITGDEEIGGQNGAKKALAHVKTDFCIALDGGSLKKIVTKEKGIIHLKLTAGGVAAHGSRPWLGENAIENLMADYEVIKTFFEETREDRWHRTINFGFIRAGESINQVPDRAEAIFDIRYTENDDVKSLLSAMSGKVKGDLEVIKQESIFLGGNSRYLDRLLGVAEESRTAFEHGASDARFLKEFGINGIVWGADGQGTHAKNECVNIDSLHEMYCILDVFLSGLIKTEDS